MVIEPPKVISWPEKFITMSTIMKDCEYNQIHAFMTRLLQTRERAFQFMIALNGILLSVAINKGDAPFIIIIIAFFSISISFVFWGIERRTIQVLDVCIDYAKNFETKHGAEFLNTVWNSPK